MSRDPLPADGSMLLHEMPDLAPYVYANNNPIRYVDPGGLQCAGSPCASCNAKVAVLPKTEYAYRGKKGHCIANVTCNARCPNDLLGATSPPRMVAFNEYVIDVCISCSVTDESLDAVIKHELLHVERFCRGGGGITNCTSRKLQEGKAYEVSRKLVFPKDPKLEARCVKCGVYFGCKSYPSDSGVGICVKDEDPPCTIKDIGVAVKP